MDIRLSDCLIEVDLSVKIRVLNPPATPRVLAIEWDEPVGFGLVTWSDSDMARTGHIRLSLATPDVTSRKCTYTVDGGPPTVVDMIDPATTISANDGQSVMVTCTDSNAAGSSPPSDPFTTIVPTGTTGGGLGVPARPTVLGVDWDPATP